MRYFGWIAGVFLFILDWKLKNWFETLGAVSFNNGIFFGWLPSDLWGWVLVAVLFYVGWLFLNSDQRLIRFGYGLILVGGLSNWLDRIVHGAVRDYIVYPVVGITGNLADVYLTIGVLVLLVSELRAGVSHED